MLLIRNDDVLEVLTMSQAVSAVEESTRRLGRGELLRWESAAKNVGIVDSDNYEYRYILRIRPLLDVVDDVAILRLNSWVDTSYEEAGIVRHVVAPIGEDAGESVSEDKLGPPRNSEKSGWLHLYDMRSGRLLAILQERDIQVMRVGAVGGLNAKYLAREDSSKLGLIGSGWMARSQLLGQCVARPISQVNVYSPNPVSRRKFADEMSEYIEVDISPVDSAEEAVRGADIVVSATNTTEPTFKAEWVDEGTHVHTVTGAEYDESMLERADVIAWTSPTAREHDAHADPSGANGDIDPADAQAAKLAARVKGYVGYREAGWALLDQYVDKRVYLTDLIEGTAVGRKDPSDITFSPSPAGASALVARFAALVPMVYRSAMSAGVGTDLPDDWFHQQSNKYPRYRLE